MKNNLYPILFKSISRCFYSFLFFIISTGIAFSQDCEIIIDYFPNACNDNGTAADPSDDYFSVDMYVVANNGGETYTIYDSGSSSGITGFYGDLLSVDGFPADGSTYLLTIVDDTYPDCVLEFPISQSPCSDQCYIIINGVQTTNCNTNGTPADPSDDFLDVVLDVGVLNGSASGSYWVDANGLVFGPFDYNSSVVVGPFSWDCSSVFLTVVDVDDPACTDIIEVFTCSCEDSCEVGIFSNAIASCPENNNNTETACEKICAYSQVDYTTDALGDIIEATWEVQGAESYTEDGNNLLVNWGAPGSGQVSFVVETYGVVDLPLSLYCTGGNTAIIDGANTGGSIYLQISGGQPPYSVTGIDGNVFYFGAPGHFDISNVPIGDNTYLLTDNLGESVSCSYFMDGFPMQNCMAFPVIDNVVYACDPVNGVSISYNIADAVAPYSYSWSGSNGFTSTAAFLVNVEPGDYELVVIDADGCPTIRSFFNECNFSPVCSAEKTICIDILENAVADFNTIPPDINGSVEICAGQEVYFENISENAEYFTWDFGTPEAFTSNNVSFVYDNPGSYMVSLISRNECLCADTTAVFVEVGDTPNPDISCTGTICEVDVVSYETSANCGAYNWVITNGTITEGGGTSDNFVTVDWGSGPVGTIELDVADCDMAFCPDPAIFQIPVISAASGISGPEKVCKGDVVSYTIPDFGGTSFSWSVSSDGEIQSGQGTNTILVYWSKDANPGMEWVAVSFESCYLECGGDEVYDVLIADEFFVNGDISACVNTGTNFVSRKASNENPVACNWFVYNPDGTLLWNSASPESSPVINWPSTAGVYEIEAFVADPSGFCIEKYNLFMALEEEPVPPTGIAGALLICPEVIYTYMAQSDLLNSSFVWEILDGNNIYTLAGAAVNVTWGGSPPYALSLTQISGEGLPCESEPVEESLTQVPGFSINGSSEACLYTTEIYTTDFYENVDYEWHILPEDAGTIINGASSATIEVYWNKTGQGNVQLNFCGLQEVFPVTVAALPEPEVLLPTGVCPGEVTAISATEMFSNYSWKNENGGTVSMASTANLGGGFYELVVTNAAGCESSVAFEIPVFLSPEINISTQGFPFYCPANESPPTIVGLDTEEGYSYEWYFNGSPTGNTSASIVGSNFGTYYLQVADVNNCVVNSNTIVVTEDCFALSDGNQGCIINGGSLSFNATLGVFCNNYIFENQSVDYIPGSLYWQFNFPENGFSYEENPSTIYPDAGFFHPVLWGALPSSNSPGGCLFGVTQEVRVSAAANFDFTNACVGEPVFFTDKSVFIPGTNIVGWLWNFGDTPSADNTSTLQNPEHIYANPGVYNIELTVTHEDGCVAFYNKNHTVLPLPEVSFAPPIMNCETNPVSFVATSSMPLVDYTWNFGDPASGAADTANVQEAYHAFSDEGIYTVTLVAKDIYGCETSHTEIITVSENTLLGSITAYPAFSICEGGWVDLIAPAGGAVWEWSTGDTGADISVNETGVYNVTVTDEEACSYVPMDVVVEVLPAPAGTIRLVEYDVYGQAVNYVYDNYTACYGEDIFLEITASPDYSYTWNTGATDVDISFTDDRGNLLSPGSHAFFVNITDDENGCMKMVGLFQVNISDLPEKPILGSNPAGPICNGSAAILSVQNINSTYTYLWSNGALGESINTNVPGEYTVIAVNPNGCKRESDPLEIFKGPETFKVPGGCHTRCNPDTVCMPEIPNIVSWQWFFNDSPLPVPEGNNPDLVMQASGDYYAVLTDVNGCSATSETLTVELEEAVGSVAGEVWFDLNDNGFIDLGDTLMQNVSIMLNNSGGFEEMNVSDSNGNYVFNDIPSTNYTLELLQNALPEYVEAYEEVQLVVLEGCGEEEEILWLCHKVCPVLEGAETLMVCQEDMAEYEGVFYPVGTSETVTLLTTGGCDSLVLLTVESFEIVVDEVFEEACAGTIFIYENNEIPAGESLTLALVDSNGCNTWQTIFVAALSNYNITEFATACENEFFDYNGTMILAGDEESFSFLSEDGCDSIVTVVVNILLNVPENLTYNACAGSYFSYENNEILAGESLTLSYTAANGCDSLLTIMVEAWDVYNITEFVAACENEFYDYNGTMIPAGEEQPFSFLSENGCDSIVTVSVAVLENTEALLEITTCEGGSYTFMGTEIPVGESAEFLLTNAQNCDSLLTVQVNSSPAPLSVNPVLVCSGASHFYEGNDYPAGTDTIIILIDQDGCDSLVQLTVETYPPFSFQLETESTCWQYDEGSIFVENISGGMSPFTYSLDGLFYTEENVFMNLAPGDYTVFIQDNNCIFQQEVSVPAIPRLEASWGEPVIACNEENIRVGVELTSGAETFPVFLWPDGTQGESSIVEAPGIYPVTISNACETLVEAVEVKRGTDGREEFIYVPNVFSPNKDGVNDLFICAPAKDVELLSFEIHLYNRWGAVLFETYDVTVGWDGSFKEEDLQPGVYVYWLKADFVVCHEQMGIFKKGDVVVVR